MASLLQLSRNRNQVLLPRAGDHDECAVAADEMAAHAVAPWLPLFDSTAYRAAAGNPDNPTAGDGLTIAQSVQAIRKLYPLLAIVAHPKKAGWAGRANLLATIRDRETAASVSVLGSKLPARLRYGYDGRHRIDVAWDGAGYVSGQPLAPAETPWQPITVDELAAAIDAYPADGLGGIILFPTPAEAFATHPLYHAPDNAAELEQIAALTAELEQAHARIADGIRVLSGPAPA